MTRAKVQELALLIARALAGQPDTQTTWHEAMPSLVSVRSGEDRFLITVMHLNSEAPDGRT